MSVICVLAESWGESVEAAAHGVLATGVVPRIAVEQERLWADAGGLHIERTITALRRVLCEQGMAGIRCGVASSPVTAHAAAYSADEAQFVLVARGAEREHLAPLPIELLEPEDRLRMLLEGVGITICGELAVIPREAVEVRFGGDAVALWRLARAEDDRRLFRPLPSEQPHATLEFLDYVVTSPEQLLFTANALIGSLCDVLAERGEHARAIELSLPLANGERWSRTLRPARPTASRAAWLRLARTLLERLTVPDAVAGVELLVQATEPAAVVQGDLFDAGFATSSAVEAALARLLESQGPILVHPQPGDHPLPEYATEFVALEMNGLLRESSVISALTANGEATPPTPPTPTPAGLTLQLLPAPRPVLVETIRRRDHSLPVRYRDEIWKQLTTVAGPDRLSGGCWDQPYAREYFRGVTTDGTLVLLFRDARDDSWHLHGWWD